MVFAASVLNVCSAVSPFIVGCLGMLQCLSFQDASGIVQFLNIYTNGLVILYTACIPVNLFAHRLRSTESVYGTSE